MGVNVSQRLMSVRDYASTLNIRWDTFKHNTSDWIHVYNIFFADKTNYYLMNKGLLI